MQTPSVRPQPDFDPLTEECYACPKCGGNGFYCMGVINGEPYSHTGFICYGCGGAGWIIVARDLIAERYVRISRLGAAVQVLPEKSISLDRKQAVAVKPVKVDWTSMTDEEMKEHFKEKLRSDPAWVRQALVALYERQTQDEKNDGVTKHTNGMGFTGADAAILTSFAQKVIGGRSSFSEKQLAVCFKLLPKYAGQLVKVVRSKQ